MKNFKIITALFGIALATTLAAKTIEKMAKHIDKKQVAKAAAQDVVDQVVE